MKSPVVLSGDTAPSVGAADREPLIRLAGVEKRFPGGLAALAGIDLEIAEGEFLSLVGPSGCGKTTLLRIIAGLVRPSAGRIAARVKPGGIGFVFQEPTLMPWATVFDNVYLPLKLAGMERRAATAPVGDAIARVGLAGFEGAYPRALSGGMKMRVSIARALVTAPRLLLMDEPFAALDEITRFKLNDDLLALWRDQRWTVVFVTHSVFESVYLSTRIAVMSARPGRITREIRVEASGPRGVAFRTSPEYGALCRLASAALAEGGA